MNAIMAKVAFRFDIDSHKCIRDGVPILLELSHRYSVPFTFYVNVGKAVSRIDTMRSVLYNSGERHAEEVQMLSARQKLGTKDYLYAAVVNPKLAKYRENIIAIARSGCELGLHGGINHSHWYTHALKWSYERVRKDLEEALRRMKRIVPKYCPQGFAAPGFVVNNVIGRVLKDLGFQYSSNWHENNAAEVYKVRGGIPDVGVNLCGEPGGVAFWEYAAASGWTDWRTVDYFMNMLNTHGEVVVFDHPYFVAVQKAELLERTIVSVIGQGHQIVAMRELAADRNCKGAGK